MTSLRESSLVSVGWNDLRGLMHEKGWPETKAGFLRAWFLNNNLVPVFPLDGETLAKVPQELPNTSSTWDKVAEHGRCHNCLVLHRVSKGRFPLEPELHRLVQRGRLGCHCRGSSPDRRRGTAVPSA